MYIYCMYYLMEGERAALVGGLLSDYRFSITVFFSLFETLSLYIYIYIYIYIYLVSRKPCGRLCCCGHIVATRTTLLLWDKKKILNL